MWKFGEAVRLNNGIAMPSQVFGTWRLPEGEETVEVIKHAVSQGYSHFDTAAHYANERSVGKAVRECGVVRDDLFVTTKLRNSERGYQSALDDCQRVLDEMALGHIDLYLIHWPAPRVFFDNWKKINADTWLAFEDLLSKGRVRAIGVSNFKVSQLEALAETAEIMPAVNQIKVCPGLYAHQAELIEYCHDKGIIVEAYSPLGAGKLLGNPELVRLSQKYGRSPAQICLNWCACHGLVPLAKSSSPERMRENLNACNFELDPLDVALLDVLPGVQIEVPDSEVVWRD